MTAADDFQRAGLLTDRRDAATIIEQLDAHLKDFNEGEKILDPNTRRLVIIVEGSVLIQQRSAGGQYRTITTRRAPVIIGELEFLDAPNDVGSFKVIASTQPTRAWLVSYDQLHYLGRTNRAAFDALVADLGRIEAKKLGESMRRTAEQSALSMSHIKLLNLFIPNTGLSFNAARDHAELETEHIRRKVVIFFSDVVDFSVLSQNFSDRPDELARITSNFLRAQADIIQAEGGEIDKFIGDEVMAFWVIPPRDDEKLASGICSRAFAAARRAAEAVTSVTHPGSGNALGLQIRVGLHIGEAHLGNYGSNTRSNFSLIGPAVNFAARLEQARGENLGAIRVSTEFFDHLGADEQSTLPGSDTLYVKKDQVLMRHSGANGLNQPDGT